ncbi:MAG: DNA topoisomerase I [Candidatus Marinimicrobia bacterium]|nr:DNA topoisomerase I [Candidatus Neomarinimicrobiota bacterium]|tara:strand:+ start:416 stop:2875 length:2460 start_codon:yes stop_codon:yes gene_type:complete
MSNKNVIIVESPSKIKTLQKFLGSEYVIEASVGHIRDLPKKNLGLDLENNFKTTYEVSPDSKKVVKNLKNVIKKADTLYLAMDPDREGEAISWHIVDEIRPKIPVKRLVFNEITKEAILKAMDDTREINFSLVEAQESRRILDRLFGFLISKTLWFNVKGGLSAGRVQSPAVKILVDREKERTEFVKSEYWSLMGSFNSKDDNLSADLIKINNQKIAKGSDFDKKSGEVSTANTIILNQNKAKILSHDLLKNDWKVTSLVKKPIKQNPYAPFITSTLQQEGIRKLYLSSQQVMIVAQKLYENGYITYMRTDSINLSNEALNAARSEIKSLYGESYLPKNARQYKSKVKNTQEAHEAIRPAGSKFKHPDSLKNILSDQEFKLYNMIWKRTVASQMKSAQLEQTTIQISDGKHTFETKGKIIVFPGFLKAYVESSDNPDAKLDNAEQTLPPLKEGDALNCSELIPKQHFTKPINRFTEASLVKELEMLGIGRPSTYATIMKKIQDKGYVRKIKGAMIPTFTGYAIIQFLENYFDELVDLQYTSKMEDDLDAIALGDMSRKNYLNDFYFSKNGNVGLEQKLNQEFNKDTSRLIKRFEDKTVLKIGRYGIYLEKQDQRATVLDTVAPSDLNLEMVKEILNKKSIEPENLGDFPETKDAIYLKNGRYGTYLQTGDKMKSLPPQIKAEELTLDSAIKILSLPTILGKNTNNDSVTIDIGRYGPYIRAGKTTQSIPNSINILNITLKEALELLASKKSGGSSIIKTLGEDKSSNEVHIKNGRYGKFITNGKVNAPMPKTISETDLTLEEAVEILSKRKPKKFKKKK